MTNKETLKERVHNGDEIRQIRLPNDSTTEQVQGAIAESSCDLIYIDAQHGAICEWDIARICSAAAALNVPVQMRLRHLKEAYLIGHFLDIGLGGIKVPEVEDEQTIAEAIQSFYFPPVGRRSWGGSVGFGYQKGQSRVDYARWWNQNGILGFKVESIKAVANVRALAQPGVDYIDFGPEDLGFDMETNPHPHLKTLADCKSHVEKELEGIDVRLF